MIPIASSTSLSIEKSAKLLKSLVDLKHKNGKLPEMLTNIVVDHDLRFGGRKQKFLNEIDNYLHSNSNDEEDLEILTAIVQPNPEFLATKDRNGMLPCHCKTWKGTKSAYKAFKLFVEIGHKHNIGGEKMRGGLLVPDEHRENAL